MENMRKDISQIKECIGRLDERTVGLPKILRHLDKDTSSLKVKVKFHFWVLGVMVVAIGGITKTIFEIFH